MFSLRFFVFGVDVVNDSETLPSLLRHSSGFAIVESRTRGEEKRKEEEGVVANRMQNLNTKEGVQP